MEKYCNEVSLKYFEKCLNHFQNWNNIFIKLENGLGKLKASSPQSKRLEMQIAGLTLDHVNVEAVILNAQVAERVGSCREVYDPPPVFDTLVLYTGYTNLLGILISTGGGLWEQPSFATITAHIRTCAHDRIDRIF
ncbi:hypothetical protein Avbf_01847 [Armadillidium vulgare]|nr:hypothetical protein Avbf_01847 [Armadillidium vulgare]